MDIMVYHPISPKNISILRKKVAIVHAEAVLQYIKKLPCSKEQKIDIVNAIKEKACNDGMGLL